MSLKWLTEKASWNSKASISFIVNPAFSRTFGVAYVGLKKKISDTILKLSFLTKELFHIPQTEFYSY